MAFFTPLDQRQPIPGWYLPSFLLVGTLTTLAPPEYRAARLIIGGLVFAALVYNTPKYTTGGANSDFVVGLFVSGITLKFWEFVYYRQAEQYAWRVPSSNPYLLRETKSIPKADANGNDPLSSRSTPNGHASLNGPAASNDNTTSNGHAATNGRATTNGHVTGNGLTAVNGHTSTNGGHVVNGKADVNSKRSDDSGSEVVVHGQFGSTWDKLRWSSGLWTTTRGVEWNWGIKDLMPVPPENLGRLNFCRHSLYRLLYSIVAIDFARAIILQTPFGSPETVGSVSILTQPFFPRMLISWLVGLQIYNALQMPYYFFATITTALGICRPEQWPPIYGNFRRHCYRVRNLWGKCWHLQIRRSITSPSTAIITKLGLKRGTNASKYANLWISFFFSAMCHTFAQYLTSRSESGNILNWMSQAAAITFEDFAIEWFQRRGIKDSAWTRGFGFLWVAFWLSLHLSLPLGANTVLSVGGAYDPPGPLELSALFPPRKTSDTLLKVAVDYGASWYSVQRGLTLINARNGEEVATAVQGIIAATALYLAR